jgi:chorismate-pyruvate lyase
MPNKRHAHHRAQVSLGHSAALEAHFGCPGPFWGRTYFFWHDGAPLTLIHEVFSNSLERYLGSAGAAAAAQQ